MRALARRGTAIVLVTHHLADVIPEIERVVFIRATFSSCAATPARGLQCEPAIVPRKAKSVRSY